jgi:hypothetical protein
MEEMAYVPPECFFEVVVPLMMVKNVAMIGITTINGSVDNYVNDFVRRRVFEQIEITLICDACRKAGQVKDCPHKKNERPAWQDEENVEKVEKIYGEDRKDQFARESMGFLKQPKTACFDSEAIYELFTKPRNSLIQAANVVITAVDPNGGSKDPVHNSSDFAMCSYVVPGMQIVGADAYPTANIDESQSRTIEYIKRLKQNPQLRNAKFIFAIESNLANESSYIQKHILEYFPDARFMSNSGQGRGVRTENATKQLMAMMLEKALRTGEVSIIREFVTTDEEPIKLLDKMRKQFLNYSRLTIPPKTPFEQTKFTYSGKGKSVGFNDCVIRIDD